LSRYFRSSAASLTEITELLFTSILSDRQSQPRRKQDSSKGDHVL
jgi:hypothetical protein